MQNVRAPCTAAGLLQMPVESGHNGEKYERKRFRKKRNKSKVRPGMVHRKPVCFSQNETT